MNFLTNSDLYYTAFKALKDDYGFNYLDYYFAKVLLEQENAPKYMALFFIMYLSMQTRKGNICIDLANDYGLIEYINSWNLNPDDFKSEITSLNAVGNGSSGSPIVIESNLGYLNRFYNYELFFFNWLSKKSGITLVDESNLKKLKNDILPKYFSLETDENDIDWQKFAALSASLFNFCAVSGGPGTGKTTTIVKIIAILTELKFPEILDIKICAPTGKAASRLMEALNNVISQIKLDDSVINAIPKKAYTIHRLLGFNPVSSKFIHNKSNRLKADILIVDEASMIDMRLMALLSESLEDNCRLILLGDRFQLASVAPGAVFGDICKRGQQIHYSKSYKNILDKFFNTNSISNYFTETDFSFSDCITELKKSYRFSDDSGIKKISDSIKDQNYNLFNKILDFEKTEVQFLKITNFGEVKSVLEEYAQKYYLNLLTCKDPLQNFQEFSKFMILSPLREGRFGVKNINEIIEKKLFDIKKYRHNKEWYNGRPVMIQKNDYKNELFNGDTGICMEDDSSLKVFFPLSSKQYRKIHPVRLNDYETVFAMTVHKSQGSEFDNILLILPDDYSEILTKELLYTAVTRAKKKVIICGSKNILKFCINNSVSRSSGLFNKLWKNNLV